MHNGINPHHCIQSVMGTGTCSSKVATLPSKKKKSRSDKLVSEGAFRLPSFPKSPLLKATVSLKAYSGLWQEAQLIVCLPESILSLKSSWPSSASVISLLDLVKAKKELDATNIRQIKNVPRWSLIEAGIIFIKLKAATCFNNSNLKMTHLIRLAKLKIID